MNSSFCLGILEFLGINLEFPKPCDDENSRIPRILALGILDLA